MKNNIEIAKDIIEDLIIGYDVTRSEYVETLANTPIIIKEESLSSNTLGTANPGTNTITINSDNNLFFGGDRDNPYYYWLNNSSNQVHIDVLVLIHEIIHMLGVGIDDFGWTNNITNNFYTGTNGLREYINILELYNFPTSNITGIPIEVHFGPGTADAHFEEGLQDGYVVEYIYDNNHAHPVIPTEIMTGLINPNSINHISSMTLGVLEDIGYIINYESENYDNSTINIHYDPNYDINDTNNNN